MAQARVLTHEQVRESTLGSVRALARAWIGCQPLATLRVPAARRRSIVGDASDAGSAADGALVPDHPLHFRPKPARRRAADPRAPVRRGPSRSLAHQIRPVARAQVRMSKRSPFIVHTSRTPCHEATQKTDEALGSYGCVRRKIASAPPL